MKPFGIESRKAIFYLFLCIPTFLKPLIKEERVLLGERRPTKSQKRREETSFKFNGLRSTICSFTRCRAYESIEPGQVNCSCRFGVQYSSGPSKPDSALRFAPLCPSAATTERFDHVLPSSACCIDTRLTSRESEPKHQRQ